MLKAQVFYKNMKQKPKNSKNTIIRRLAAASVLTVAAVFVLATVVVPNVRADNYQEQIRALEAQNAQANDSLYTLAAQAGSYQDAINRLQTQIAGLQEIINKNLTEQAKLHTQIEEGKKELSRQKALLAEDIKAMYVDGEPTTIEMLASSGSLSDFVDKEEYRTAVQKKIQDTLKKIQELQRKLEDQKTKVDQLLKEQQAQQAQLASAKAEQDRLLAYNQGQQAAYNAQIRDTRGRIDELRRLQAIENARLGGGVAGGRPCDTSNGDTYPASSPGPYGDWGCSYPLDNTIDNWGMYNRECVSYTAWKVYESGRKMPYWGGIGNANQWDDNARRAGIPVDTSPRAGDVAVKNRGEFGHVMYVEHVYGDGSILVSDYNQQWDGAYRRYTISRDKVVANDLQFIHFYERR